MHSKNTIPYGYCHCGCGGKTSIAKQSETKRGYVKGEPMRYLPGHATKRPFWSLVDKSGGADACWIWQGRLDSCGYGMITISRRRLKAHRVAYEDAKGQIPTGLCVCHSCDNPACVNPSHLWLGTHKQNMEDRNRKGRARGGSNPGSKHPSAKLTEDDVRKMRELCASGVMQKDVAKMFSVSVMSVSNIVRRKTWRHVD